MDLTKFNKEELEILKKAFGNNLNIGYLNTLSNTEEEKFITIINKYHFEEEKSNSKLNEKIKELVKELIKELVIEIIDSRVAPTLSYIGVFE